MALEFPESPLALALRLLEVGRDREAEALLLAPREDFPEAERLALLGFLEGRKGDLRAYRALALEAARRAQTSLTLYHLGLALPPKDGVVALEEAFHRAEDPKAQGRFAFALARTLRRLGRLREALGYAALAQTKGFGPFAFLEWAWLALLTEEEPPLPELLRRVEPLALERGTALYARFLMAHLRFLQGEEESAQAYLRKALEEAPPQSFPYLAPSLVRLLPKEALLFLQAARPSSQDPLPQALLALAEGLWREDLEGVRQVLPLLAEEAGEEALRALLFLGVDHPLLGEVSSRGRWLLWPQTPPGPYLQVLGEPRLQGKALPLRQAELLVLLLARPQGFTAEALAEALYGEANLQALRMELHRLRQRGLALQSRPYRLASPLRTDFLEMREALAQGDLRKALALYRGPLLPQSQAPGVEELRWELEETLRQAVLNRGTLEDLYTLAQRLGENLELWEALLERLPPEDPRRPIARARVARLRREWGL